MSLTGIGRDEPDERAETEDRSAVVRIGVSAEGSSVTGRRIFRSRTLRAERLNACWVTTETESGNWRIFGGKIALPQRDVRP